MSKTVSVFKPVRCKKCDNLILKSEKHECQKLDEYQKRNKHNISSEIKMAFENIDESSLTPSQISHFINKVSGWIKYTHFEIKFYLDKHPNKFNTDESRSTKYDKYYTHNNMYRHTIETDIESETKYYIPTPRAKHPLTYSIKKLTIIGANRTETTLAMVYGEKLAEILLQKCKDTQA